MNKSIWYFAHPYTCKDAQGRNDHNGEAENFLLCCKRSAVLILKGWLIYSPITHCHPIHIAHPEFINKNEYQKWMELDQALIEQTNFRGIIMAPGWKASSGCRAELQRFISDGKDVLYYEDALAIVPR